MCANITNVFFEDVTTLPIEIFAVIFYLFISSQQSNIYTDMLTGMNNRRKAEIYMSSELSNVSEETPLYMFMGDINGFAARYGGDEFVWAWRPVKNGDIDPEIVINDIQHRVEAECRVQNRPYVLSLSIGCVICTDPKKSFTSYIKAADKRMYAKKEGYHRMSR